MIENKGGMPMMGRMRKMMGNTDDFDPREMCQNVLKTVAEISETSFYASQEIRTIFEEWLASVEEEIFEFVHTEKEINLDKITSHFKISKSAAKFFLNHLATSGKIKAEFNDKPNKDDER